MWLTRPSIGPRSNGVIERFFGTLKYTHLYRAPIDDSGAFAMETARFRDIHNRIRPHQAIDDRTPRQGGSYQTSRHRAGRRRLSAPLLCRWRFTCETARAASVGYVELVAAR
jgi:Integrase core domain